MEAEALSSSLMVMVSKLTTFQLNDQICYTMKGQTVTTEADHGVGTQYYMKEYTKGLYKFIKSYSFLLIK